MHRIVYHAAPRAAFYVSGAIALFFALCGLSATAYGQGTHLLSPDGHALTLFADPQQKVPIASIQRKTLQAGAVRYETFAVNVASPHRFQFATETAPGYGTGERVTREIQHVSASRLGAKAATHAGWRDPLSIDRYTVSVTYFTGLQRPDGRVFIDVRTDPTRSGFVIVITTIHQPRTEGVP